MNLTIVSLRSAFDDIEDSYSHWAFSGATKILVRAPRIMTQDGFLEKRAEFAVWQDLEGFSLTGVSG